MSRVFFILHRCSFALLSQFHFNNHITFTLDAHFGHLFCIGSAFVIILNLVVFSGLTSQPPSTCLSIGPLLGYVIDFLGIIIVQNILVVKISNLTHTVIFQGSILFCVSYRLLGSWIDLFLFVFDEFHEFVYVLEWVEVTIVVFFATRTVDVLVLLTGKVFYDPL